ncbi:MAG: hypothetical protein A3F92_12360 [Candidatus Rokubacteria bacterium RIFCSPLOWO2_12_FULL_71_22]|nr:MAG: hypothetical protein A3F92_12360 [Candidatus Rokubacteria bacterium RIFCSPLOWO2_12_FULL_71_22]
MPALSLETGLDPARIGLLTGTLYAGYAVALWASGFLPLGRRRAIVGGFLLTALGNVAFARSHSLGAMLVIAALGGAGIGLYLPRGTAVIVETFPPAARARAMGWHEVSASAGLMLGSLYVGALLLWVDWRTTVALWSVVGVAVCLAVWRWVPEGPATAARGAPGRLPLDARMPALAAMGGACFAIIAGFFTMLPTIAARGFGVAPAAAASFTGWTRSGGLVGALAGGWAADLAGRLPSLTAWFLVALVAVAGLAFLDYGAAFGALVVVMTVAASAGATAYYALLGDAYRPDERERVFSVVAAAASLVGSVATPVALGVVLSAFSARATLVALAGAPLLGLAGVLAFRRATRAVRGAGAPEPGALR